MNEQLRREVMQLEGQIRKQQHGHLASPHTHSLR